MKMKKSEKISKKDACFLFIAGLFMGTVFIFGTQYWNAEVTPEECRQTTGVYSSYELDYGFRLKRHGSNSLNQIIIYFDDREKLYIDSACADSTLIKEIHNLEPGTKLSVMIHPNSDNILQMQNEDYVLLDFESAVKDLRFEANGFTILGVFMYFCSLCGLYCIVFKKLPEKELIK